MSNTRGDTEPNFVGMRGKTWEHQAQAMAAGYDSTAEMAIDMLADRLFALENRVDALDRPEQYDGGEPEPELVEEHDSDAS